MPLAFVPCVISVVKGERVGGWEEVVEKDQGFRCFVFFTPQRCHLSRRLSRGFKSLQYFFCCLLSRNSTSRTRAATRTKSVSCFANPRFGSTASANARLVDDGRPVNQPFQLPSGGSQNCERMWLKRNHLKPPRHLAS